MAPLALALAEDFLTGRKSFFVMVVPPSLGAISQYVHAVIRKANASLLEVNALAQAALIGTYQKDR